MDGSFLLHADVSNSERSTAGLELSDSRAGPAPAPRGPQLPLMGRAGGRGAPGCVPLRLGSLGYAGGLSFRG